MKALIGGIIGALVVAGLVVSLNAQRIPALQASGSRRCAVRRSILRATACS
mgnify:CR=1 FL=1